MTSAPVIPFPHSAGEGACERLAAMREELEQIAASVVGVQSAELAAVAAQASAVVAAAEAARAAIVVEASTRGVIGASDHPRPRLWVEQSCREAGVPLARGQARQLHDVALTCSAPDVDGLRVAVTEGRLPLESAAVVARVFRRLRATIAHPHWDELMAILIEWAAEGASAAALHHLEDRLIGQYGTATELDDTHERLRRHRDLSTFRRDRSGMLTATLRLDPASEAVVTAAIQALSAPHLDADGEPDPRTPGQRRADALVTVAERATTPDRELPGSGVKSRVVVTVSLSDLVADLGDRLDRPGERSRGAGFGVTGFGQPLSPSEVRMLACDAQIMPAVLGGQSELLDLGHAKRLVTPGLTAALHLRDQGCTYPGCDAPPSWCDGHHIVHWARGGRTDMDNLALLCRHHHTVVHRHDHAATVDHRGVHWTRSDGTPIGNTPRWPTAPPRPA